MFATIKDVDSDAEKSSDNSDGKEFEENVDKSTDSYKSRDGKRQKKYSFAKELIRRGDKQLLKIAAKNANRDDQEAIRQGKLRFRMPKPNVDYHLTDFNSDEEVGRNNLDLMQNDLSSIQESLEKLEKIEDLFILAEQSKRPE